MKCHYNCIRVINLYLMLVKKTLLTFTISGLALGSSGLLSFAPSKNLPTEENVLSYRPEHGATPWQNCFGPNASCSHYGCSEIEVTASYSSDVMVTIKRNGKIVKHAFIHAGRSYTFELPDGTYQPFFYYGKNWDPNKVMNSASCSSMRGGYLNDESFDKDDPVSLKGQILTYELIEQINGNFDTKPSNAKEAF